MPITKTIGQIVDELSIENIRIWMAEDIKRTSTSDEMIATATRVTNVANVKRNKLIQAIDEALGQESFAQGDSKMYGTTTLIAPSKPRPAVQMSNIVKDNTSARIGVWNIEEDYREYCSILLKGQHVVNVGLSAIQEAKGECDVVVVIDVIERSKYPGLIVEELFKIKFKKLFVVVPCYTESMNAGYEDGVFIEPVTMENYAWYSPYTLFNLFKDEIIRTNAQWSLCFFDNQKLISILISNVK